MVKAGGTHYSDVIRSETLRKGVHTTAEDLVEAMSECWRIAGGGVSDGGDDNDDDRDPLDNTTEMAGVSTTRNANATCYNCGKKGHFANKCPHKRKNGNYQKTGETCHYCGKRGHRSADCWEKEENADSRPDNWVSSKKGNGRKNYANANYEILVGNVEMTAQEGSGILKNEKMNAQDCSVILRNGITARKGSGIGITARKGSGIGITARTGSGVGITARRGSGIENGITARRGSGTGITARGGSGIGITARKGSGVGITARRGSGIHWCEENVTVQSGNSTMNENTGRVQRVFGSAELGRVSEIGKLALTSSSCCVQCARYAHDEKGFDEKEQKSRYEF